MAVWKWTDTWNLLQELGGKDPANEILEIREETKGQTENLYYVDVEETECSRCCVVKSTSSSMESRIGASNLRELSGRETLNAKHEMHKEALKD